MAPRLLRIDHVQLAMPAGEEETATGFYQGLLGLPRQVKPPALAARGGCWFGGDDDVRLHLGVEEPFRPARKAHPALIVEDLDGLCRRLEASGLGVRWDDELPGVRRCYVDDPFGNRLELIAS